MKTSFLFILMLTGLVISAQVSFSDGDCKALFKYEVNDKLMMPYAATAINFYDVSLGTVKEWYWDFGDGNTSREQNPMFIFKHPAPSPYVKISPYRTVSLTIKTENCKSFYSIIINIMDGTTYLEPKECQVWFGYAVNTKIQTFAPALVLDFYPKTVSSVKEWKWDFGDGTGSVEPNPTHIFNWPLVKDSLNGKPYPFRTVTLTIITQDGCIAKRSETINIYMDTNPPCCPYVMRIKPGFPIQMSSCAGWAQAQVFLKDSAIKAADYSWSTGVTGQEVKNLCAASTYTVKAKTADGCVVACTFILNSDGTIKEIPVTWWVNGSRENMYVQYNLNDKNLKAEWKLPDGTIVKTDSISLNSMYGGSEILDLIVRDSTGNIVFAEKIALKASLTSSRSNNLETFVELYPNPVKDVLNIDYSGRPLEYLQLDLYDLSGRIISKSQFRNISTRQVIETDTRSLQRGIYFCKMIFDHKDVIVRKFIK
jgi:hypothetical protein